MSYPHKKQINLNGKPISVELHSDADASVFNEVFTEREYGILDNIIANAQEPIVDIGAHIGMFSIYAASLNPNVQIFAYEPEPKNYQNLKRNFKLNQINSVYPKNLAVASEAGNRVLYMSEDSHTHSLHRKSNDEQIIYTTTLPQIVKKIEEVTENDHCELLKMDCESAEFEILGSAPAELLQKFSYIYFEFHEFDETLNSHNLKQLLEKSGFKVRLMPSPHDPQLGFIFAENLT